MSFVVVDSEVISYIVLCLFHHCRVYTPRIATGWRVMLWASRVGLSVRLWVRHAKWSDLHQNVPERSLHCPITF